MTSEIERLPELAVERLTEFELVINQMTATAMGITIAQALLLREDELIRWE